MIKFWAFIYRKTGWYSPWARAAEYRMLRQQGLFDDEKLSISVGMWQVHYGFTRTHKQAWRKK